MVSRSTSTNEHPGRDTLFTVRTLRQRYTMNWDSEREMAKDVEENEELYEALADDDTDDDKE